MSGLRRAGNAVRTTALLGLLTALIIVVGGYVAGTTGVLLATVLSLGLNAYLYFNSDTLRWRTASSASTRGPAS